MTAAALREELARVLTAAHVRAAMPDGTVHQLDVDGLVDAVLPVVEAYAQSAVGRGAAAGTTVTEWALLRGEDAVIPGTVFAGPVPATSRPAWDGYSPGGTDGMTTVRRIVIYGPWTDLDSGQQVEAACCCCGRPAGAGEFARGRLCNGCAVAR